MYSLRDISNEVPLFQSPFSESMKSARTIHRRVSFSERKDKGRRILRRAAHITLITSGATTALRTRGFRGSRGIQARENRTHVRDNRGCDGRAYLKTRFPHKSGQKFIGGGVAIARISRVPARRDADYARKRCALRSTFGLLSIASA